MDLAAVDLRRMPAGKGAKESTPSYKIAKYKARLKDASLDDATRTLYTKKIKQYRKARAAQAKKEGAKQKKRKEGGKRVAQRVVIPEKIPEGAEARGVCGACGKRVDTFQERVLGKDGKTYFHKLCFEAVTKKRGGKDSGSSRKRSKPNSEPAPAAADTAASNGTDAN